MIIDKETVKTVLKAEGAFLADYWREGDASDLSDDDLVEGVFETLNEGKRDKNGEEIVR